jgi:hypothetical protein
MGDLDLAHRAHLNMVGAFASLPPHQPGGFVRRSDSVVVAATGSPVALFNEILPVDEAVTADALVRAVEAVRMAGLASFTQLRWAWLAGVYNDGGSDRTVSVWAVCATAG